MQIISLESENIKGIKAVRIDTAGKQVVIVGGKNGAGKSSVLDSIFYALGGKDVIPSKPIRNGEKKARITLDLGDITVERTFTEGGSKVTVKSKAGANYPSPQAMLDALCSRLAFDPLEFSRLDAKKQAEQLRKLVGIDFTELDTKRKAIYDERTLVNRQLASAKAKLASAVKHDGAPATEVSLAELTDELSAREANNKAIDEQGRKVDSLQRQTETCTREVEKIDRQLAELTRQRASYISTGEAYCQQMNEAQDELNAMKRADVDAIRDQIRTAGETNAKVAANLNHAKLTQEAEAFEAESEALSASIADIDAEKEGILKAAEFPVPGLSLSDEGVTFNGLPLKQASSSEQIRTSAGISMAMNNKLRFMSIRDATLLDDDGLAIVEEMAGEKDYQLWLERQTKNPKECTVFIEDGSIKEFEPELAEATT